MKVIVLSSGSKGNTTYIESKKTRILKDMILEVEPEKRTEFIESETKKLFDDKLNIDYSVTLNKESFKNIIKVFSKKEWTSVTFFDRILRLNLYRMVSLCEPLLGG